MDIILKQDVNNLGYKNDIVSVKPGYGRNFLIPQGLAILATERNRKILAEEMRQQAHKEEKIKNEALEKAKALEGLKLQIPAKAAATGKIFGSVNTIMIANAHDRQRHQGSHQLGCGPQTDRPQRGCHQGSGRIQSQNQTAQGSAG